jgi:predicted secreted acid phosphatase
MTGGRAAFGPAYYASRVRMASTPVMSSNRTAPMHRTLLACLIALLAAVALTGPASAATTRTPVAPAQLSQLLHSGAYDRGVASAFASATKILRAQLKGTKIRKPAVVVDIDETALSNMGCLQAVDFDLAGLAICVAVGKSTAIAPARRFVATAQKLGARVFFITGAPQALCASRTKNLHAQGFTGRYSVTCRPASDTADSVVPFKSGQRARIEKGGSTIVLDVGDQRSDLSGGHARRTVLVPNPAYVVS